MTRWVVAQRIGSIAKEETLPLSGNVLNALEFRDVLPFLSPVNLYMIVTISSLVIASPGRNLPSEPVAIPIFCAQIIAL